VSEERPRPAIDQDRLRTAVIGCGRVGALRAEQASIHSRTRLLLAVDAHHEPARHVAERFGSAWSTNWNIAIDDERIDIVVVATPHDMLYEVASAAMAAGKHVVVEKPMGSDLSQAQALAAMARGSNGLLKIGCHHRYHAAMTRAHQLVNEGAIGDLVATRARYGNAGVTAETVIDYEAPIVDLSVWFAGAASEAFCYLRSDNVFGMMRFVSGCIGGLHACATHGEDLFSFELLGKAGSISIDGLAGTNVPEKIRVAKRDEARPNATQIGEESFGIADHSFALEWNEFVDAIQIGTPYLGTPDEGLATMRVVHALADAARDGVPTPI
jgi:myo-inositol 2-dehydrogenase/D-chiro-inositol 1-dehydrogenase